MKSEMYLKKADLKNWGLTEGKSINLEKNLENMLIDTGYFVLKEFFDDWCFTIGAKKITIFFGTNGGDHYPDLASLDISYADIIQSVKSRFGSGHYKYDQEEVEEIAQSFRKLADKLSRFAKSRVREKKK